MDENIKEENREKSGNKTFPNRRQKRVFKKVMEKGLSVRKAMIEEGYSPKTYKNPDNLTNSKGWEQLMKEYIPDELLALRHQELLNKREVVKIFDHQSGEFVKAAIDQPDTFAVGKALDLAYKVKKKYNEETANNQVLIINIPKELAEKRGIITNPESVNNREGQA